LITGAGGGIGTATARAFVAQGASVLLTDLSLDAVQSVATELSDADGSVHAMALDVTDEDSWQAAVAEAVARFGGLDTLVNVAGIVEWPGVQDTDRSTWDRVIAVNQTGTWLGMKVAMPALLESGDASIVNTSSILGIIGGGGATAYHASKGAVRLITKTAAVEYAARGVRVNSIHPGVIDTPMIDEILETEGDQQSDVHRTPMKRAGTPQEVAAGIVFLASSEASFVTGSELVIDGGITAH
jgi:3alpha(or 20beta)-hydroxysteroid dehydrogenase